MSGRCGIRSGLVVGFWLGISPEVAVRCELKLQTLKACLQLEDPLPRWFAHMADRLMLASWFLSMWACTQNSKSLPTRWLAFPRAGSQREKEGTCSGFSLESHAPLLPRYSIILLFTQVSHNSMWKDTTQGVDFRRPSEQLATTSMS